MRNDPSLGAQVRPSLRQTHPTSSVVRSGRWHLDEVIVRIGGQIRYLCRAVDDEGEVLDVLVQSKRDRMAALKLMRRLLKRRFDVILWISPLQLRPSFPNITAFPSKAKAAPRMAATVHS